MNEQLLTSDYLITKSNLQNSPEVEEFSSQANDDEYRLSFHRTPEASHWKEKFSLLPFSKWENKMGPKILIIYLLSAPALTALNSLLFQLLVKKERLSLGFVLFSRSLLVIGAILLKIRFGELGINLDFQEERLKVLVSCFIHAVCNLAFLVSLYHLPISSAFCIMMLMTITNILVEKNWKYKYEPSEIALVLFSFIGIIVLLYPWQKLEIMGASMGILSLFINFGYRVNINSVNRPISISEIVLISSVFSLFLGFIIQISDDKYNLPSLLGWFGLVLMSLSYLLGLAFLQRAMELINNEVILTIYIFQVLLGFLLDYFFDINQTDLLDLVGAIFILAVALYGKIGDIYNQFWDLLTGDLDRQIDQLEEDLVEQEML